jgi:hypothetical protein
MIRFIKNFMNKYYELDKVAEKLIKKGDNDGFNS